MPEYIERNAIKQKLQLAHDFFVEAWGSYDNLSEKDKARVDEITNCIAEIVNAPAADVALVRHGKWIPKMIRGSKTLYCSECESDLGSICEINYCPNCGAKMDK